MITTALTTSLLIAHALAATPVWQESLPASVPTTSVNYSFSLPTVNAEYVQSVASRYGVTGGAVTDSPKWMTYTSGNQMVRVGKASGFELYINTARWERESLTGYAIADSLFQTIATNYLTAKGNIPSAEVSFDRIDKLTMRKGTATSYTDQVSMVAVKFKRTVGGLPVNGAGAVVYISNDGTVVGFEKLWRPLGATGPARTNMQPAAARDAFLSNNANIGTAGSATVLKARFGYWENSRTATQKYLQPGYSFLFTTTNGAIDKKYMDVVPAQTSLYEPILQGHRTWGVTADIK